MRKSDRLAFILGVVMVPALAFTQVAPSSFRAPASNDTEAFDSQINEKKSKIEKFNRFLDRRSSSDEAKSTKSDLADYNEALEAAYLDRAKDKKFWFGKSPVTVNRFGVLTHNLSDSDKLKVKATLDVKRKSEGLFVPGATIKKEISEKEKETKILTGPAFKKEILRELFDLEITKTSRDVFSQAQLEEKVEAGIKKLRDEMKEIQKQKDEHIKALKRESAPQIRSDAETVSSAG